jgi:dihydropyrimidinase
MSNLPGKDQTFDLVIKNGTLVTANEVIKADLGIQGEAIAAIGPDLMGIQVIDVAGKLVIPGGVDPHVHLQMQAGQITTSDDWYTGTIAAACGGTTTVIDFIEAEPQESLLAALEKRREQAKGKAVIDFGLHMTVDRVDSLTLEEIPLVISEGVTSYKCYTTYSMRLVDESLILALESVGNAGGLTIVHAENHAIIAHLRAMYLHDGKTAPSFHPSSRPAAAEGEAIERVLALAEITRAPVYIVHVSTERGSSAIARARVRGQSIFGETCPQYLILTEDSLDQPGFDGAKYVCSPPLRTKADQQALWNSLANGTLQTVGTDHCPFYYQGQKDLGRSPDALPPFTEIPGGIPGIEARLALIYTFGVHTGHLSLTRWVDVCSTGPAKIFGLYPRKGALLPGSDADIVIFDPGRELILTKQVLHENVDYTPYEGFELKGYPIMTLVHGRVVVKEGQYVGGAPAGRFLRRQTQDYTRSS